MAGVEQSQLALKLLNLRLSVLSFRSRASSQLLAISLNLRLGVLDLLFYLLQSLAESLIFRGVPTLSLFFGATLALELGFVAAVLERLLYNLVRDPGILLRE